VKTKLVYEKFIHFLFKEKGWEYKEKGPFPESSAVVKNLDSEEADNNAWYQKSSEYSAGEFFYK
jgi:hypothetical protein